MQDLGSMILPSEVVRYGHEVWIQIDQGTVPDYTVY